MPPHTFTARINRDCDIEFKSVESRLQKLGEKLFADQDFGSDVLEKVFFELWIEREPNLVRQLECRPYPCAPGGSLFLAAHLPWPTWERASIKEAVAQAVNALAASARTWPERHPVPQGFDYASFCSRISTYLEENRWVTSISPMFLPRFTSLTMTHQGARVLSKFKPARFIDAFNRVACSRLEAEARYVRNVRIYLEYAQESQPTIVRVDPYYSYAPGEGAEILIALRLASAEYGQLSGQKQLDFVRDAVVSRLREGLGEVKGVDAESFVKWFGETWGRAATAR